MDEFAKEMLTDADEIWEDGISDYPFTPFIISHDPKVERRLDITDYNYKPIPEDTPGPNSFGPTPDDYGVDPGSVPFREGALEGMGSLGIFIRIPSFLKLADPSLAPANAPIANIPTGTTLQKEGQFEEQVRGFNPLVKADSFELATLAMQTPRTYRPPDWALEQYRTEYAKAPITSKHSLGNEIQGWNTEKIPSIAQKDETVAGYAARYASIALFSRHHSGLIQSQFSPRQTQDWVYNNIEKRWSSSGNRLKYNYTYTYPNARTLLMWFAVRNYLVKNPSVLDGEAAWESRTVARNEGREERQEQTFKIAKTAAVVLAATVIVSGIVKNAASKRAAAAAEGTIEAANAAQAATAAAEAVTKADPSAVMGAVKDSLKKMSDPALQALAQKYVPKLRAMLSGQGLDPSQIDVDAAATDGLREARDGALLETVAKYGSYAAVVGLVAKVAGIL